MRIIPSTPLDTGSHAENRTFDQLRKAFSSADKTGWFALHSLNLPQHEYKRFGEIDFLICGPEGIFVLEVKGGGVSCKDGIWETRNRYGQTSRLKESPFKQAEGAMHGLVKKLPDNLSQAFVIGYGVIIPDVENFPNSAEWDRSTLADAKDFKQFEKWLTKLIKHWRDKDHRKPIASPDQLKQLQQFLRPNFEMAVPLHIKAEELESKIAKLTQDQFRFIDMMEANDRIVCTGGAGTGKTLLALELAKRWMAQGLTVAITCHSPWLKSFLEKKAPNGLVVTLAESISVAARRAGVDVFDAIIIDEGQDILNMSSLEKIDSNLKGGLDNGRWCFFLDINNQTGLCGSYEPEAYDYLMSLSPAKSPLKTNCRNTLPIISHIKDTLHADMGNDGIGDGLNVRHIVVSCDTEEVDALEKVLEELIEKDGFNYNDITILSPLAYKDSLASKLTQYWRGIISPLDSTSPFNSARNSIGFAQISDFKGLESEVVVLVDLPKPNDNQDNTLKPHHYVGMSRARVLLCIISRTLT